MKKKILLFLLFEISFFSNASAQKVYQYEEELSGQIFLVDSIAIPYENAGYTLLLPDDEELVDWFLTFINKK